MSELIKHECGIAVLKLLKPSRFYAEKYGDTLYGINTIKKLMQLQKHRGQDGAGIASCLFDMNIPAPQMHHFRSTAINALEQIFKNLEKNISKAEATDQFHSELYLGHLRYGTFGRNSKAYCHPFLRESTNISNKLALAGNFNLTNIKDLYKLHLKTSFRGISDAGGILEIIGHYLDKQNRSGIKTDLIEVLEDASKSWDGGYVMAGLTGAGEAFVIRDAAGIRPAYQYINDEVFVVASERYAIQKALNVPYNEILEVKAGYAFVIDVQGKTKERQILPTEEKKSCSFERIYFSHGDDIQIQKERRQLGAFLLPEIKRRLSVNINQAVFSYVPQTAKSAFDGLIDCIHASKEFSSVKLISKSIFEKKTDLRLFISNEKIRNELTMIAFENLKPDADNIFEELVIVDDSIARGNTLKNSVLKLFDKIYPKKIIIASSSPQLRYPDCYGIDLARIDDLIAFKAAIELLKEKGLESLIEETYQACLISGKHKHLQSENHVKNIYAALDENEISKKIAEMIKPKEMKSELQIIFQSIDKLHQACPEHSGDWYFTGKYPSQGGNKIVNKSFINFIKGNKKRAYN